MSWLSSLFDSGPSSDEINARAAQSAQQQAALAEQRRQFDALQAASAPTDYDRRMQELQMQQLNDEATRSGLRQQATASLGGTFAPEFEQSYLPSTYDDPYIASAYASERGKVDDYLNNLLKRGVITQTGYEGGQKAAGEQEAGVRAQLNTLGENLLEAQRGKLTDIGNRARSAASTVDIGQTFDPNLYGQELQTASQDIGRDFGDLYSSSAPQGLFDLTDLANKAGATQGAQNLAFNPTAVGGSLIDEETQPQKKGTTAVF